MIEKRDLTHGGGWVPAVNHVSPYDTHATVPRLLEGTTYEFRVRAENLQGLSEPITTKEPVVAKNQYGELSLAEIFRNSNALSIVMLEVTRVTWAWESVNYLCICICVNK